MEIGKVFTISPPEATDDDLAYCNPKHPSNMRMVSHYIEVIDKWLETEPFSEDNIRIIPENSVLNIVRLKLLDILDPDDDNNIIDIRYVPKNSYIYVVCNHVLACKLLMLGYELIDLDLEE